MVHLRRRRTTPSRLRARYRLCLAGLVFIIEITTIAARATPAIRAQLGTPPKPACCCFASIFSNLRCSFSAARCSTAALRFFTRPVTVSTAFENTSVNAPRPESCGDQSWDLRGPTIRISLATSHPYQVQTSRTSLETFLSEWVKIDPSRRSTPFRPDVVQFLGRVKRGHREPDSTPGGPGKRRCECRRIIAIPSRSPGVANRLQMVRRKPDRLDPDRIREVAHVIADETTNPK